MLKFARLRDKKEYIISNLLEEKIMEREKNIPREDKKGKEKKKRYNKKPKEWLKISPNVTNYNKYNSAKCSVGWTKIYQTYSK